MFNIIEAPMGDRAPLADKPSGFTDGVPAIPAGSPPCNIIAFKDLAQATLAMAVLGLSPGLWMPVEVGEDIPCGSFDKAVVFYRPTTSAEHAAAVRWVADLKAVAQKVVLL